MHIFPQKRRKEGSRKSIRGSVEVEQEMSAPPPKKNPGSARVLLLSLKKVSIAC